MLNIYDQQTATAVLGGDLDSDLRVLIEGHLFTAKENGLSELTHIAILEPGDTEQTIIDELGFTPLVNPISGKRFGQDGFEPAWDWMECHPGFYEIIACVGDSGYAFLILVPSGLGLLAEMCAQIASGLGRQPENSGILP